MNVRELLLDVIAKATGSRTEISEETNLIQILGSVRCKS